MGGRIMFFERATREILDKPRLRVIGEKPKITLPRLKFMERPMPPWDEPTPRKPPVRRKILPRPSIGPLDFSQPTPTTEAQRGH